MVNASTLMNADSVINVPTMPLVTTKWGHTVVLATLDMLAVERHVKISTSAHPTMETVQHAQTAETLTAVVAVLVNKGSS